MNPLASSSLISRHLLRKSLETEKLALPENAAWVYAVRTLYTQLYACPEYLAHDFGKVVQTHVGPTRRLLFHLVESHIFIEPIHSVDVDFPLPSRPVAELER